ncbi:HNH endonuclease signature motif containing protein [Pseudomonas sp.]|uniref:HNH endonuclease n=1 Tax=Pseudomonas sp. TaxID=306 RepID=UPI002910E5B9|nr:HNH endonuclease signature motif containing protein [Pseudomonas sp.]MDU4255568.1 HNH endonuclease signature motif containing protein [Pseudomonas sp.]
MVFLHANPLCAECMKLGRRRPATVVDHIVPHRGDSVLFWRRSNWQPLCKPCHDSYKQRVEKSGEPGCDAAGVPRNPGHHWNLS